MVVNLKKRGAEPAIANPWSVREAAYMNALPELHAEVKMTALTKCGRPLIPAFLIPKTNGDELALPEPDTRCGSLLDTIQPAANMPET